MTNATPTTLHIYFLLDRSGSMASMATDVIGGFNSFVTSQAAEGPGALMTLVQFDSEDSHDVLANAVPLGEVAPLDATTFVPRGGTPLYDAIGHLVADATIRGETVGADEDILFVIFTDGEENQSTEYTRASVFNLIERKQAAGWTFVFMGANQEVYAESAKIGMMAGNVQSYRADGVGSDIAFTSIDTAVKKRRRQLREHDVIDKSAFFDEKPAEADLRERP
jgi:Mg-chelatase subunit ChlD